MRKEVKPATAAVVIVLVVVVLGALMWRHTMSTKIDPNNRPSTMFGVIAKDPKAKEMLRKRYQEMNGGQTGGSPPASPQGSR